MRLYVFLAGVIFIGSCAPQNKDFKILSNWNLYEVDSISIASEEKFELPSEAVTLPKDPWKLKNSSIYWLKTKVNCQIEDRDLALSLGSIKDADEVYWNGIQIGSTGRIGTNAKIDFQRKRLYSIPNEIIKDGENQIAIRIFTITEDRSILEPFLIGKEKSLRVVFWKEQIFPILSGFIFIFMGSYFLIGAIVKDRIFESVFFSGFSIFMGLYVLLRSQFRDIIFSDFTKSYITELLILVVLPILFVNFLYSYLDKQRQKGWIVYEIYSFLVFLFILFSQGRDDWGKAIFAFNIALPVPLGFSFYLLYSNGRNHWIRLRYIILGILLMFPAILVDSFTALGIWNAKGILYWGFLVFLILISMQITEDFHRSMLVYRAQEKDLAHLEKVKNQFLSNLSSELKSGFEKLKFTLAKMEKQKSKKKESSNELLIQSEEYIDYLHGMVKEAILLREIERKKYSLKKEFFDTINLSENVVRKINNHLGQRRDNVNIKIDPSCKELFSDPYLLSILIRNLAENAFLYTPLEKKIEIIWERNKDLVQLTVSDEGPGLSDLELETIFQKFVRGSESKKEIPGAGIGLTLVQEITDLLEGKVQIRSGEETGSKFIVTFPERKT